MKHNLKITLILIIIFFISQLIGLAIVNEYIDISASAKAGKTVVNADIYNLTGSPPPEVQNEGMTWILILIAVLFGTGLVLLIIKFKQAKLWKLWFSIAMFMCLRYALAPFINKIPGIIYAGEITIIIAIILTYFKVFKHNLWVHNISELFIYGGLAAVIVPIINLQSAIILLILISLYDMYAVWQSKHMVKMAQYQTKAKVFAGLMIPYNKNTGNVAVSSPKPEKEHIKNHKTQDKQKHNENKHSTFIKQKPIKDEPIRNAILGGGDVAFPLLFSSALLKSTGNFINPIIITITTTIALFMLLTMAKKNKFYPAMPFISAGCFIGYAISLLI